MTQMSETTKPLTFEQYQERSQRTAIYRKQAEKLVDSLPRDAMVDLLCLLYAGIGLAGEAGELAGKIKKVFRDDDGIMTAERFVAVQQELGGTLWYAAALAEEMDRIHHDNTGEGPMEFGMMDAAACDNLVILARRQQQGTLKGDGDERGTHAEVEFRDNSEHDE